LQSPANHYFSLQKKHPINLSNCKHEIRHHPRLFLSGNDDSVVLPDQLRPALPIDLVPLTLRGSRCALFSVLHQHSASDLFHQIHFSLRPAPFPYLILPIAPSRNRVENACGNFLLIASSCNFDVCYDSSAKLLSNHIHKVHVGADPVSTRIRGIWEPFIDTLHGWRTLGVVENAKKC
jgi:hypothetical protein